MSVVLITGRTASGDPVEVLVDADGTVHVTGGVTAADLTAGTAKFMQVDGSGNIAPAGDTVARHGHVQIVDGTTGVDVMAANTAATAAKKALVVAVRPGDAIPAVGAATPAASLPVTGSLASSAPTTVADATGTGSAVQLGSLAAGPSGIRVQNTSATGGANIRVGESSVTTTRGAQITPGNSEIFAVSNANLLYVIAESGSPTYGVSQA